MDRYGLDVESLARRSHELVAAAYKQARQGNRALRPENRSDWHTLESLRSLMERRIAALAGDVAEEARREARANAPQCERVGRAIVELIALLREEAAS